MTHLLCDLLERPLGSTWAFHTIIRNSWLTKYSFPHHSLSNAEKSLRALCKEGLKPRKVKFPLINVFFFICVTGYFASRLASSWGIAELTSDMVLISWRLCFLLSTKKSLDYRIKARHLKGMMFLPPRCYTSYLLSLTPKLHNCCFSLVTICYLLRLSHFGLLSKEASPGKEAKKSWF